MSWAKVQKINSDMAKPINELLEEYHKEWLESYTLVPSDNAFAVGSGRTVSATVKYSGIVRIRFQYSSTDTLHSVILVKNGVDIVYLSPIIVAEPYITARAEFAVSAGDQVSVEINVTAGSPQGIALCGDLVISPHGTIAE